MTLYTLRPISDRTPFGKGHENATFDTPWSKTRQVLARELEFLRAKNVILEVDFRDRDLRLDGELRADARPLSGAVRLAFESKHGPLIYATDRFVKTQWGLGSWQESWQHNVRAIALGLEALRKVDRYGVTRRGEQYAGWKALPAGQGAIAMGGMTATDAAELLERLAIGDEGGSRDRTITRLAAGDHPDLPQIIRHAKAVAHPDRNDGDRRLWDQVEQAIRVLERTA